MKVFLSESGIDPNKIICLNLFDYLVSDPSEPSDPHFAKRITVAGNLSPQKAGYIYRLMDTPDKNYSIDLYGSNWNGPKQKNGVEHHGSFQAEELARYIDSGFGLVWDGDSIEECEGGYGKYLRYNNPHKLSSYIACGVPTITWSKAAVAPFVTSNNIGITVSSLSELNDFFDNLQESEYKIMARNVQGIRKKILSGGFLKQAISTILSDQ